MRALSLSLLAWAACSPYSPELGATPYLCGSAEPRCPDDYDCRDDGTGRMVCFQTGSSPDSGGGGLQCANDGPLEPNDMKEMAYATGVSASVMRTYGPLSICPETDRDHFLIDIPDNSMPSIDATTTWTSGMPISVAILNSTGMTIKPGVAMGNNANRACAANLPMGTYYVVAFGASKNNYMITMKFAAACQ